MFISSRQAVEMANKKLEVSMSSFLVALLLITSSTAFAGVYNPNRTWNREMKVKLRCLGTEASGRDRENYEVQVYFKWEQHYVFSVKMYSHLTLIDRRTMKVVSEYEGADLETERNSYSSGWATDYQFPNADLRFYWKVLNGPNSNTKLLKGEGQAYFKSGKDRRFPLYIDKMACEGTEFERSY